MQVTEIIARLRSMNHLIELDPENLPPLNDDENEWSEGWVRFHDTMSGCLVCVNQSDEELDEDGDEALPIGTTLVCSGNDYDNAVTIPTSQMEKYILAEQMKSNTLMAASQVVSPKLGFSL